MPGWVGAGVSGRVRLARGRLAAAGASRCSTKVQELAEETRALRAVDEIAVGAPQDVVELGDVAGNRGLASAVHGHAARILISRRHWRSAGRRHCPGDGGPPGRRSDVQRLRGKSQGHRGHIDSQRTLQGRSPRTRRQREASCICVYRRLGIQRGNGCRRPCLRAAPGTERRDCARDAQIGGRGRCSHIDADMRARSSVACGGSRS